jgi:hypothetical protein
MRSITNLLRGLAEWIAVLALVAFPLFACWTMTPPRYMRYVASRSEHLLLINVRPTWGAFDLPWMPERTRKQIVRAGQWSHTFEQEDIWITGVFDGCGQVFVQIETRQRPFMSRLHADGSIIPFLDYGDMRYSRARSMTCTMLDDDPLRLEVKVLFGWGACDRDTVELTKTILAEGRNRAYVSPLEAGGVLTNARPAVENEP